MTGITYRSNPGTYTYRRVCVIEAIDKLSELSHHNGASPKLLSDMSSHLRSSAKITLKQIGRPGTKAKGNKAGPTTDPFRARQIDAMGIEEETPSQSEAM